jgi:hypothetical protein
MENELKLTTKQRLFVEYFVGEASGNASLAAKLAGYKGSNETLRAVGAENLAKPHLAALCQRRVTEAALSSDRVLSELSAIALDKSEATRDRIASLSLLGKFHQLFTDNLNIKSNGKNLNFAALVMMANQDEKS